jgi:hypothetical protein
MDKTEADRISSDPAYATLRGIQKIQGQSAFDRFNKLKTEEEQMRSKFNKETGSGQDFQKWRNYQEVQAGTPYGQSLMSQRLTELGGDVNSPEYKDLSLKLRNSQLSSKKNTLY